MAGKQGVGLRTACPGLRLCPHLRYAPQVIQETLVSFLSTYLVPPADHTPVQNDQGVVCSFGNPADELQSSISDVVCVEDAGFHVINVTGDDRLRVLHNLTTNDIQKLQPGDVCETFFTTVKARIVQNGYVSCHGDSHRIWLPGGPLREFLGHLKKYAFRSDVAFEVVETPVSMLIGPNVPPIVSGPAGSSFVTSGLCGIRQSWGGSPVVLFTADAAGDGDAQELQFSGRSLVEHWRIQERLPVTGVDLTEEHLAPEAGRNAAAISYQKGCYLGQEPIARIHAMGHVNRQLYRCRPGDETSEEPKGKATSFSNVTGQSPTALVVLRVSDSAVPVPVTLPVGSVVMATVAGADVS